MKTEAKTYTMTLRTYSRTDSGKSWRSKPDDTQNEEITDRQYKLLTSEDTMKCFRRMGGSETATRCYTSRGYQVIELASANPERSIKHVRTFSLIND